MCVKKYTNWMEYHDWIVSLSEVDFYNELKRIEASTDIYEGEISEVCCNVAIERYKALVEKTLA
jgi:hypothetical protein